MDKVFGRLTRFAVKHTSTGKRFLAARTEMERTLSEVRQERDSLKAALAVRIETEKALSEVLTQRDQIARERDALKIIRDVLVAERDSLQCQLSKYGEGPPFVPNGHFYSPIPSKAEIQRDEKRIFADWPRTLPNIDLRESQQVTLLEKIATFYHDLPFQDQPVNGLRYRYKNTAYGYSDAIFLNGMLRHLKPNRVIEIGSGYSSCMLLDTNERWLNNAIKCSFIEPYPELLNSLLTETDRKNTTIYPSRVQDVDLALFSELGPNDVLFIDSTHVGKTGSDVNHLFFEVLPALKEGVYIHIHDIFFPFEYPRHWAEQGIAWNEQYMLRTFLQNNFDYEIVLFNTFLTHFHADFFRKHMPLCLENPGGSIWLRKTRSDARPG
ncbi:class I SAM-dependent methyltransferase [Paraburkholderia fungorum]|uniref:class I SAM-dependent methyltransferase n=1 Tax=Paraburkholderia fungorum TaxID=134537 RepID=UPI000A68089B|nr:class I SAM-dependent methyltransferase [Paraburkholderia fungorum]USX09459.1 class I SAM-dependent methyltransferase [Paraburkholderia fungorum]